MMTNNYPRKDMHQAVTAADIAKLEATPLPDNDFVTHEDHLGGKAIVSREADHYGVVTQGYRVLHGASRGARDTMNDAAKHDYRHVVDVESIKTEVNRAASGLTYTLDDLETP